MRKHLYHMLFVLTLLFDTFFIYTIISSYNNLEEKTAWVQEFRIAGRQHKDLEMLVVYNAKDLKTIPNIERYHSDGFQVWSVYDKFKDSLSKNSKLIYEKPYPKPKFGDQIYFYTTKNKFLSKHIIGYHLAGEKEPSTYSLIMDLKDSLLATLFVFVYFGFIFIFAFLPTENNVLIAIRVIGIISHLIIFFL